MRFNLVLKNFSYLTISRIIIQLLSFVAIIKVTSILTVFEYGNYALVWSTGLFFTIFALLGINQVIVREVANNEGTIDFFFKKVLSILLLNSFIVSFIIFFYYKITSNYCFVFFLVSAIILICEVSYSFFRNISFGKQEMLLPSVVETGTRLLLLLFIFIYPFRENVLFVLLVGVAIIEGIKAISIFLWQKSKNYYSKTSKNCDLSYRKVIKLTIPFAILLISAQISSNSMSISLGVFSTPEEIGYYNIGRSMTIPIMLAIGSLTQALCPTFVKYYKNNFKRFRNGLIDILCFIFILGSAIVASFTLFSKEIILLVFGDKYIYSIAPFNLQIWTSLLLAVFGIIGVSMVSAYKSKAVAILSSVSLILFVPAIIISSHYGAKWLALGVLIANIIAFIYHWIVFNKTLQLNFSLLKISKYFVIFLIMLIISNFTNDLHFFIKICLSIFFMVFGLLATKHIIMKYKQLMFKKNTI